MSENSRTSRTRQHQGQKKSSQGKKRKSILLRIFLALVAIGVAAVIAGAGLFFYYVKDAPALDLTKLSEPATTRFLAANGDLIYSLGSDEQIQLKPSEVPQVLSDAVVSVEDKRFYKHFGVDPIRIIGSALGNLKAGGITAGGSTLDQQLIKLSFFSTKQSDQTLRRKAQEAWLALKLERELSKEEILTLYINRVYMANGVYGIGTAAESYYGIDAKDLSVAQAALLAGIPNAPNTFDPYTQPENATKRRNVVLQAMLDNKKISQSQYDEAVATDVQAGLIAQKDISENRKIVDNYLTSAIAEVKEKTGKDAFNEGMDIYLNIDLAQQTNLYNIVNSDEYVEFPDDQMQVASTIIDPTTGAVVAQIGGRKIDDNVQFGINRATNTGTAGRDVGSTIKPLIDYGPAFEYLDYSTGKIIKDEPYTYPGTDLEVNNYDHQYLGNITLRYALTDSRNIPAVKTLVEVGVDKANDFLTGLGINLDKIEGSSAISAPISTEELAGGYAAFANNGTYSKPYYVNKIVYQDGTEESYQPESSQAMKETTAYMVTDILKDVVNDGTGVTAEIPGLIQAGKTGTSNYDDTVYDQIIGDKDGTPDVSFVGYTTHYVMAVWTGYDNYLQSISPSYHSVAAKVYKNMMIKLAENVDNVDWEMPADLVRSGGELYLKGSQPKEPVRSSSTTTTSSSTSTTTASTTSSTTTESSTSSSSSVPESSSSSEPVSSSTEETTPSTTTPSETPEEPTGNGEQGNRNTNGNNNGTTTTPPSNGG